MHGVGIGISFNRKKPFYNLFGTNSWCIGYFHEEAERLGAYDGFKDVAKYDAIAEIGYEDVFTNVFESTDLPGYSGYLYMDFWAKWNNRPSWEMGGEWLINPSPNPLIYQFYRIRNTAKLVSDGGLEYFRFWYSNSDNTSLAYIADPIVYKEENKYY